MEEKEFQKIFLSKIREVLKYALESPYSDFYRKKYKGLDIKPEKINSYEDFKKIPLLTKDEILSTPLKKRLFIPMDDVTHYAFSSGTTSQNKVLIMPHRRPVKEVDETKYVFDEKYLKSIGVKNFLILLPTLSGAATMVRKTPKKYIADILGDTSNLRKTALVAEGIGIDSVVSTATIIYLFIEELKKVDFDFNKIKWIWLLGEHCGKEKYNLLKSTFPNAKFNFTYGAAESTSGLTIRGYRCKYMEDEDLSFYHTMPVFLFETIDNDEGIENKSKAAEIIQTDLLTQKAFPLIRYKTGDVGITSKTDCQCGNSYLLELCGRDKHDVLKFHGTTLYAHLIEESLRPFEQLLEPFFQMHIYEKSYRHKIVMSLILHLSLKEGISETPELKNNIKITVEEKLLLAIGKNLKYFVNKKLFSPLEVEFVKSDPANKEQKIKHLVSHIK